MNSHVRWLMLILALSLFCIWVASPPEFKGVRTVACAPSYGAGTRVTALQRESGD